MMVQAQNDQVLWFIFIAIIMLIPGIVLWFDDRKIHENSKKA